MSRADIYYWKCDRPAAFHGTQVRGGRVDTRIEHLLLEALRRHFQATSVTIKMTASQGNHLTWSAEVDGTPMFLRVENGPENDDHLAVESAVMEKVCATGVPVPQVYGVDATRAEVPFAWQAMERIEAPDLNHWHKQGTLDAAKTAFEIGAAVATWQELTFDGFGPLDAALRGYHVRYADYFHLRLTHHLDFLVSRGFFTFQQRDEVVAEIAAHGALLDLERGCFVHKDLALWNVLGTQDRIAAFIDFDDAVCGDPMDDLSLLACFHDGVFATRAFEGYASRRALPADHLRRFWLHLLRNMIVKAVIRVGAGYFDRDDGFFLIGSGSSGANLRLFTHERLAKSLQGLRGELSPSSL